MLGFDAIASLPISSIPADSGNVNISGDAASLVFTGQNATIAISIAGTNADLLFTGQNGSVNVNYTVSGDNASLVFTGQDATVTISGGDTDTHDGYWYKQWAKLHKKKPTLAQVKEIVKENLSEALAVPEIKKALPEVDYASARDSAKVQAFIAEQLLIVLLRKIESDEEDDIEIMMLL